MGGRGGKSLIRNGRTRRTINATGTVNPQSIQTQAPTQDNTPSNPHALTDLAQMTDQELAQLVNDSRGVDMPNYLHDVHDRTQEFVYTAGLNEKPIVLDDAEFDQYMKDNNIPQREILSRSVDSISYKNDGNATVHLTADDVSDIIKDSKFNYIGGKHGGQVYGAGTYFDMNGGRNTGYGGQTMCAVLNPQTAKVIDQRSLIRQAQQFATTHPQFTRAVGGVPTLGDGTQSIWALAMGYNVITDSASHPSYHNIIDRSAIVIRKKDI